MKRFKTEDFKSVNPQLDLLIQMQQARFDKKHHGVGLSIQEDAEHIGITNFLAIEEEVQTTLFPTIKSLVDEWFKFKDNVHLNEVEVIEKFDSFIVDLMSDLNIK